MGAQAFDQLDAIDLRHVDVGDDETGLSVVKFREDARGTGQLAQAREAEPVEHILQKGGVR